MYAGLRAVLCIGDLFIMAMLYGGIHFFLSVLLVFSHTGEGRLNLRSAEDRVGSGDTRD